MRQITERLFRAKNHLGRAAIAIAVMATSAPTAAQDEQPWPSFVDAAQLVESVPTPESVIGFAVGDDAVRYEALVRYLHALAEASPFVTLTPYGQTHEDRTLYYLTITSVENHARLDQIRADNAALADPRKLINADEAARIVEYLPGIAWLAYSIHGDETSPCDSAMMIAYLLAAGTDEATADLRNQLVINIDPLQNPDGRERYLSQIQTLRGQVPNPDVQAMHHAGLWSAGRGNHYLFDMNRDWLMQTQPETRGRAAAILAWHPHLLVDAHEMGALDTYLFDPPREPLNVHLAPTVMTWRLRMSADQASAFNRYGWSYYTKEWYDEWYPGYGNAWGTLIGAIGLLYEQAGVNGASVKQAAGNVLTYRQAVHQNVVSSFANLQTLRANRQAIIADYLAERQWAVAGEGPFHETFLFPPSADQSRRQRLLVLLDRQGIEYEIVDRAIEAGDVVDIWGETKESLTLPAGTAVVRSAQPHRRLLHAILGFDPHMTDEFLLKERHDLENGRGTRMYGGSAWNLPMAYGLEAYMAARVSATAAATDNAGDSQNIAALRRAAFGYLIPFDDSDAYRALARLLAADCKVRITRKPFTHNGRAFIPGAILLRNNENPSNLMQLLRQATEDLSVQPVAADTALSDDGPDLGGRSFVLLHEPRVAIASQWPTSTTAFGAAWYLLDHRAALRASPINIQRLGRIDLRKYNVLILPSAYNLRGVLGNGGARRLRTWIEGGGTLIAIGGSAAYLAGEDSGLSSVRLRRDVLDQLAVYEEYVKRELAAREVAVDPQRVWANVPPAAEEKSEEDKAPRGDLEALQRADAWARTFSPRGTIVAGTLNGEHWLCFGLGDRLPLLVSGGSVFMSKPPAATPVRLADLEHLRLSGLLWPEARPRLAHSAYATVERLGNGQVILFAGDPLHRAYWEGTGRLLLNAVILGPGMGTSQPLPW